MLSTSVAIISPASIGGGQYTFNLHFSSGTDAKFLRVGDYIESGVNSDRYEIVTWVGFASDFVSSGQVTVNYVDNDVGPTQDGGFNSSAYTPGQVDVRPEVRTEGAVGNITTFSGQNFEYQLEGGWNDLLEANKAQVGDSVVDFNGKEFEISHLEIDLFNSPFRVIEVVKEGDAPVAGTASLYRSTQNISLYQGTPIQDPSRTVVRNRDNFNIDLKLAELENSGGSGDSISKDFENLSGVTITAITAVKQDASGNIDKVDVSDEGHVKAIVGVTGASIANTATGSVTFSGYISDVTTGFIVGNILYLDTNGDLTLSVPEIGVNSFVAGDSIVKIGMITENPTNPAKKDLLVNIAWEGVL